MHDLESKVRSMIWNVLFPVNECGINREILRRIPNSRTYVDIKRSGRHADASITPIIEVIVTKESKNEEMIKPWSETTTINIEGMEFGVYHDGCKNFDLVVYGVTQTIRKMLFKHSKEDYSARESN